jgi:YbgC/YbaW family acyl-CoA thioester hydrolase
MSDFVEKRSSVRRQTHIDVKRRRFNRREKEFSYQREIYLSDTNAFQNVYFANYAKFIGEAREDFLQWALGENISHFMKSGINLATVDMSIKYKASLYVFDCISVIIKVPKISKIKIFLDFTIINNRTSEINATASMTLCAIQNHKPIVFPEIITDKLKENFLRE